MKWIGSRIGGWLVTALVAAAIAAGCGGKGMKYDTELLANGSFEKVGDDGIPKGWKLIPFRGAPEQSEVQYGIDKNTANDGTNSWFFRADPGTRLFHMLAQEIEVKDATHVRLRGWMQVDDAGLKKEQWAQCNFLLTFYDQNHNRFQELRIADKRTPLRTGSHPWTEEDRTFRLPRGTRYVQVSCVLGMNGQVWFDNVSLSVPKPLDWESATTKNFVFHWLPGHPMPAGAQQTQQQIFDVVAGRLGVTSDVVIFYYFYPDTATIRSILSLKGFQYVSFDDNEFHSINANDNHEIVHFITDPYGRPPRAITEGTVYWLLDELDGRPIDAWLSEIYDRKEIPPLSRIIDYNGFATLDQYISMPVAASFVRFVVDQWGTSKLMEIYSVTNGANTYESFAAGFERVCGVALKDAEPAWRERLRVRLKKK